MNDIEQKALALVNEVELERALERAADSYDSINRIMRGLDMDEALCRAIEQHEADKAAHTATIEGILKSHEAFRQEVSDELIAQGFINAPIGIGRFIIPAPKPDPLVEALKNMDVVMERLEAFRAALEARELEIREKGE
jgi:hypothetical protein